MHAFTAQLKRWAEQIDDMSLRERALLFAVVIGVLYALASTLAFAPLQDEQARLEKDLKGRRDQIQLFEQQIQGILGQTEKTAGAGYQARVTALRERLYALDASLGGATQGLVSPKEMARLVERVLKQNRGLRLVKMENLPPEPLTTAGAAPGSHTIYKHGLRLELRGNYIDMVNYLRALEALPWKVLWGEVSLQADAQNSTIRFVVYTLSLQQSWIGV